MRLYAHPVIYGVQESGIQVVSDFMIPFVCIHNDSESEVHLNKLSFHVSSTEGEIIRKDIEDSTLVSCFCAAVEEWRLYRFAAWERILGISKAFPVDNLAMSNILRPGQCAVLHQMFFRLHASYPANKVTICLSWDNETTRQELTIVLNPQKNEYYFPIHKPCFVTGCYIDPDAHRWCRNSEFAIDIGLPAANGMLDVNAILGEPVYAAADGIIQKAVGCVGAGETEPEVLERKYGNDVRIDGNHIILEHDEGECSLYAHLQQLAKPWKQGDFVRCGELLGYVGSTGNSSCPHLHFHVFKKQGNFGPAIPIVFKDILDIYGEPLDRPVRDDTLVFPIVNR